MYNSINQQKGISSARCPKCNSTTVLYSKGELTCRDCGHTISNKRPSTFKQDKYIKICKKCCKEFKMKSGVQKYCIGCTTFKCKECGNDCRLAGTIVSKFCSKKCFDNYRRGKPMQNKPSMTKEQRERAANSLRKRYTGESGIELKERISKATILAMKNPEVQDKIRKPRSVLSLERRMQISNNLAGKMPANLLYNNSYSNIKRGYYNINGDSIFFRSKWEANYALYLDWLIDHKEIIKWEFEPDTFMFEAIKLGTRSYTPDFKIFNNNGDIEYHEVKGYMDSKSKTKLKRFAKYYPYLKLVLIDSVTYSLLKKQIGKICKFY